MRILITLTTAVLAAATALASSNGDDGAYAEPPCHPLANAAATATANASVNASATATADASGNASVWVWPLAMTAASPGNGAQGPLVLRGFEPPLHRWDAGHRGVDLVGSSGAAIVAAGAGTVLFAGHIADQGVVVVGHGVLRTSYEPVEATVPVGAQVARGQRIGTLDAGHCAGVACLHWGLLTGHGHATVYYDPLLLLGCGGVRLEPTTIGTEPAAARLDQAAADPQPAGRA